VKLRKWLFDHRLKVVEFAKMVGTGRCYIHQWMTGAKPSEEMLGRVREITMGQVSSFEDLVNEYAVPRNKRKKSFPERALLKKTRKRRHEEG